MMRILSLEVAQQTILRRTPFEEVAPPPHMAERIRRTFGEELTPSQLVDRILRDIREQGDTALRDYARRIDGFVPEPLEVTAAEMDAAWEALDQKVRQALELAAGRIRDFHQKQPVTSWLSAQPHETLGQLVRPLDRVGLYVPGGTAPLPSSLLMSAIPAVVAGVAEIIVATPPQQGTGAAISPVILAAARVAGVRRVFKMGGAQAIAALAFGTERVPRVDKIAGPGGLFPVLAMRKLFGVVGIAGLPGPTETMVIADESANPAICAADLLAQAEHDELASAILLTPSEKLARQVQAEIDTQMTRLERRSIIAVALERNSGIVLVDDISQALTVANQYAPEHLCLLTRDPWSLLGQVRHAGGVFLGEQVGEALGDYVLGPSHVMPTRAVARFGSPLNVLDFVKLVSVFSADAETVQAITPAAIVLAEAECLTGHAAALRIRLSKDA
ncbi:MAG: histidinol dehydrogenase [Chloroflexi bacterium]|nr:histidinol dehydrogenase [Chloroflexota bacterium]